VFTPSSNQNSRQEANKPKESSLSSGLFLGAYLELFGEYLKAPDISEICINEPGRLWIEKAGEPNFIDIDAPAITKEKLLRLARMVAAINHQSISKETPLLSASLKTGERIQIALPPAAPKGPAISIRKQVLQDLDLEDYEQMGAFNAKESIKSVHHNEDLQSLLDRGSIREFLKKSVTSKKNILLSGGTSSGKTTFLNALLKEIPAQERIVTIEDTVELIPHQKNHLCLLASKGAQGIAKISINDLLECSLRFRPDRILLGELRGSEAYTYLRAINTGHPGSITTIHADSPQRALSQLSLMIMQAGLGLKSDQIRAYCREVIDIIIQLKRSSGRRFISDIQFLNKETSHHG